MLKSIKFVAPITAVLLVLFGCEETPLDENGDGNGDGIDSLAAEAKVDSAISALEDEIYALANMTDISGPGEIDFSTSNTLFKEALGLDPENLDANFGAGLTEMLVFSQDPDVQAVFDAWEAFLDSGSAFVADTSLSLSVLSRSTILPGAFGKSPFQVLNEKEVAYSYLNLYKLVISDPPTIGDIQDVMESVFLPRLDYALERFDIVDEDPTYTFTITPKMQGDLQEDPVEFDLTELYVLEAAVNLIRSFCSVAVAYTVGSSAYDSTAIIEFLSQGSGFLSLRTNGATQMAKAGETLLDASYKLDDAVAFLKAETDPQSDDIITITPGELEEADLDSVTQYNAEFRDYFLNGITLTEDWDGDYTTPDEDLTFNFSTLFDTPIQDFKSLLPDYTVTVGRDTSYDHDWESFNIEVSGLIDITTAGYYNYNRSHSYDSWDDYEYSYVDTTKDIPEFTRVVDSLLTDYRADQSLSHWSVNIYWYGGYLSAGQHQISETIYCGYERRIPEWSYYTGIITFDAATYAEWIFPNPSINGFLQEITSDADLKVTFGITEADFLKAKDKPLVIPFEFFSGGLDKQIPASLARTGLIPWASRD